MTTKDPAQKQEDTSSDTAADLPAAEDVAEEAIEVPETEEEAPEAEADEALEADPDAAGDDGAKKADPDQEQFELVVEGSAPPQAPKDGTAWARLRKENAAVKAELAELKRRASLPAAIPDPGEKPTLESCEFDPAVFETRLDAWKEAKAQRTAAEAQAATVAQKAQATWEQRRAAYTRSKEELAKQLPSYEEAEAMVRGVLSPQQQDVVIHVAENAARVVAALGQNPKLAQEFAETTDPILLGAKIARLEARISMKKKTQVPPPEKKISGTGPSSGVADSTLERLRAEAAKTGDLSKVNAYRRSKRQQAA